ncbi:MAG: hypothetical protein HY744_25380 [Deltaproteobacteria bacterium]|nr:hypothetical protein [Deltaproteobacteria bacterium]
MRTTLPTLLLASIALAAACSGAGSIDEVSPADGTGAAGATSSTSGGAGAGPECEVPGNCPGEDSDCRQRTCDAGKCGVQYAPAGSECHDAGGQRCNDQGECVQCLANDDCAAPKALCNLPKGNCVECLVKSDCDAKPGTACSLGACACPVPGQAWCAPDGCLDVQVSTVHCGSCGHGCASACEDGQCAGWEAVSAQGAPAPRWGHVSLWTGQQMIVWGGALGPADDAPATDTGGMYDPATSQWTATSLADAPSPRVQATAVWTGHAMIVWGGRNGAELLGTGGIFEPAKNQWTKMPTKGAPSARFRHSATWCGKYDGNALMIVWGGTDGNDQFATGGQYAPEIDTWQAIVPAPAAREQHSAACFTERLYVYGGIGDVAGKVEDAYLPSPLAPELPSVMFYSPEMSWTADDIPTLDNQPSARAGHSAVWAKRKKAPKDALLVWGGRDDAGYLDTGAEYRCCGEPWVPMAGSPPEARAGHAALYLDASKVMVVWGGVGADGPLGTGGVYDSFVAGAWKGPTPATTLLPRHGHTAVETGSKMIVWGGRDKGQVFGDGGLFTP